MLIETLVYPFAGMTDYPNSQGINFRPTMVVVFDFKSTSDTANCARQKMDKESLVSKK